MNDGDRSKKEEADAPTTLEEIGRWADQLQELGVLEASQRAPLDAALNEARMGRLDHEPEPLLTILLLGPSGVGKSQLLNALAGEPIANSDIHRPTTTMPTIYAHRDVHAERLFEYGSDLVQMARQPSAFHVHGRPELRNKVIIDAPDIDSYRREHRERVWALLPVVDVVLFVVSPQKYRDAVGWQTVLKERGRRGFAFVLNQWDPEGKPPKPAGAAEDIDADFRRLLQQSGYNHARIFRTSALYWVEGRERGWPLPIGDEFPALQRWLTESLSTSRIEQIQRRRRRALWGEFASAVSSAQPQSFADVPWLVEVRQTLDQFAQEGPGLLQPMVAAQAQEWSRSASDQARPQSVGLFGLYLRAVARLDSALRGAVGWTGAFGRRPGVVSEAAPVSDLAAAVQRYLELLSRRLSRLESKARQQGIPFAWMGERWRQGMVVFQTSLTEVLETAPVDLLEQPYRRWQRWAAGGVLLVVEMLLTCVQFIAIWRLTYAFATADYLGQAFVLNAGALIMLLLVTGQTLLAMVLPRPAVVFRRRMESAASQVWRATVGEFVATAETFISGIENLRRRGEEILKWCDEQIRRNAPLDDEELDDHEAGELFANADQGLTR